MIRLLSSLLFLTFLSMACPGLKAQEGSQRWIFEGLVTQVDSRLVPDLQSGWVLSGSFILSPIDLKPEPTLTGVEAGRLAGGVTRSELSLDVYHQLQFQAKQVPGMAGLDYQNDDPEADGRDLMAWFFPVKGEVKENAWASRWLQIWLTDASGNMFRSSPPLISPYGIEWERAWFRLTFVNDKGEMAYVDGHMEVFAPEGKVEEDDSLWRGVAAELSEKLLERDATILTLKEELASSQSRLAGLRQMVDLLVEERTHLEEENSHLKEQVSLIDPEIETRVAELSAEKVLLEGEINDLEESLAKSEQERLALLSSFTDFEQSAIAVTKDSNEAVVAQMTSVPDVTPIQAEGDVETGGEILLPKLESPIETPEPIVELPEPIATLEPIVELPEPVEVAEPVVTPEPIEVPEREVLEELFVEVPEPIVELSEPIGVPEPIEVAEPIEVVEDVVGPPKENESVVTEIVGEQATIPVVPPRISATLPVLPEPKLESPEPKKQQKNLHSPRRRGLRKFRR